MTSTRLRNCFLKKKMMKIDEKVMKIDSYSVNKEISVYYYYEK